LHGFGLDFEQEIVVSALNKGSPDRGYGAWEPGLDENGPPHLVRMTAQGEGPGTVQVTARVIQPLGADILVFFELGGREAVCRVPPRTVR
jgi:hypothetical protein